MTAPAPAWPRRATNWRRRVTTRRPRWSTPSSRSSWRWSRWRSTLAALTAAAVAGGVSALGMPLAVAGAQFTIRMLLARLVVAIAVGAAVNVAMDSVVQAVQLLEGHRDRWNTAQTARAAEDGAIYGAATGLVFLGGARLAPGLMSNPWGVGGALGVTGCSADVGGGLAHGEAPTATGVVMAMVSGVVGGLGPGPHSHRPLATEADARPTCSGWTWTDPRSPGTPMSTGPSRGFWRMSDRRRRPASPRRAGADRLRPRRPGTGGTSRSRWWWFCPRGPHRRVGPGAVVPPAPGPPAAPAAPGPALRSELPPRADHPAPGSPGAAAPLGTVAAGAPPAAGPPVLARVRELRAARRHRRRRAARARGRPHARPASAAVRSPPLRRPAPPRCRVGRGRAGPGRPRGRSGRAGPRGTGRRRRPGAEPTTGEPTRALPAVAGHHHNDQRPAGPASPVTDHEALVLARHTVFETDAGYGFYAPGDTTATSPTRSWPARAT
jgi:hypothetical protein